MKFDSFRLRGILIATMSLSDKSTKKQNHLRARRDEEKEQRRLTIIKAAERVVAKRGWAETNFGEIAEVTRLSRSLIYVYFPTKEDLLAALVERANKSLAKRFHEAVAEAKNGNDAVIRMGSAYYRFSKEEPSYFELISHFDIMPLRDGDDPGKGAAQAFRDCLEIPADSLKRGIQDGSISKSIGDPKFAAFCLYAFTHGLIQMAARRPGMMEGLYSRSPDEAVADGARLLNRAIATE
jgi:AcrR family transcriptional regulator